MLSVTCLPVLQHCQLSPLSPTSLTEGYWVCSSVSNRGKPKDLRLFFSLICLPYSLLCSKLSHSVSFCYSTHKMNSELFPYSCPPLTINLFIYFFLPFLTTSIPSLFLAAVEFKRSPSLMHIMSGCFFKLLRAWRNSILRAAMMPSWEENTLYSNHGFNTMEVCRQKIVHIA